MQYLKSAIQHYRNLGVQAKAAVWYTVSNVLQRGISFFVVPIYIRIISTKEYGEYSLFQSWNSIILVFATLNLYAGVFTKSMVDYNSDRERYTSSMQGLNTLSAFVVFIIWLLVRNTTALNIDISFGESAFLLLFYITYPATCYWLTKQQVSYRYMKMITVSLSVALVTPIVSLLLLRFTGLRVKALIYGYVISQTIFGTVFYIIGFVKGKTIFIKEYWIKALKFNIPLIPHYLSLIVLAQADRIMIGSMCGEDKAGIYTFAYQIALLMSIITSGINSALLPWLYGNLKNTTYSNIRKTINYICAFVGIMTLMAILVSPEIVHILGTADYNDAINIIPAVAISVYCTFCYGLYVNVEFYYSATKYVMLASTSGAILNIVLNYIFIERYGYIAAGYTTLICYFLFMVMHFVFSNKVLQQKGIKNVYDNKFIFGSVFAMLVIMSACLISYSFFILRIIIIALLLILVFIMRKRILGIVKDIRNREDM